MAKLEQSDLDYCLEVTRRGGSNLWFVGRSLPAPRRGLFASAYASIRVIDDFVDDDFLARTAAERAAGRADAHRLVSDWLAAREEALAGRTGGAGNGLPDARILNSVASLYQGADIGALPWRLLARSMHHDIDEEPFRDWDDFVVYCEGATVAPASIFLYVVAANLEGAPAARHRLPADPADCVRDMAIFCYLVHIARDITKDAAAGPALLTIPDSVLGAHGLTHSEMAAAALREGDPRMRGLILDLAERAGDYRKRGEAWRDRLLPLLGLRERTAFSGLMAVYGALHDRLCADPDFALLHDPDKREAARRSALAAADIEI